MAVEMRTAIRVWAGCQLMSGPDETRCPRDADGVWRLGTEQPYKLIPMCGECMDGMQEQLDEHGTTANPEMFLTFH